ncbi:hypothetical protein DFH28DRAFT_86140 [Melampsora americana]|nr:hypothetical protein DFH28DRAFT_86140 [Melampsora americana]
MKPITYICFMLTHFLLHGSVTCLLKGFYCDLPETYKPSKGVCAPPGLRPNGTDILINFIKNPQNARQLFDPKKTAYTWWTCDYNKPLVSYCCTVIPDNTHKVAAACRRQNSN